MSFKGWRWHVRNERNFRHSGERKKTYVEPAETRTLHSDYWELPRKEKREDVNIEVGPASASRYGKWDLDDVNMLEQDSNIRRVVHTETYHIHCSKGCQIQNWIDVKQHMVWRTSYLLSYVIETRWQWKTALLPERYKRL